MPVTNGRRMVELRALRVALAAWLWQRHGTFIVWLPVFLAAGIALYFTLPWEPAGMAALGAGMLGAACLFVRLLWPAILPLRMGCGVLGACAAGFALAWAQAHMQPAFPDLPRRAVHVSARVVGVEGQTLRDGTQATRLLLADARFGDGINIGMPPLRRRLLLRLRADDPAVVEAGDRVSVQALLTPPAFPAIPGGYDAQRRAWFDGLAGYGRALEPVSCVHGYDRSGVQGAISHLRQVMARRIRAVLPGPSGAVAATVLVGWDGAIDGPTRAVFADAGLAHLLAVAGLHLAIVMGLVMAVTRMGLALWERAALFWPCRQIAALSALLAGAGYVLVTGSHLPALRSLFMATLAIGALLAGRRALSMRSLAVAAGVLLCLNPENVAELSLQMSMAAVMALIAGFEALRPLLSGWEQAGSWWRRVMARLAHPLAASVLAGGACIPVGMAHFGTVQPWFVLANLVAVPLMSIWIMPWGLASFMLMPMGLEKLALVPMGYGIGVVEWLARHVASLPVARMMVPAMDGVWLAVFFAGLCWLCLWSGRVRLMGVVPIVLAVASAWVTARPVAMVSPDARMVAFVSDGRLLTGPGAHPDPFVLREWQRATGLPAGLLPSDGSAGSVLCRGGWCRLDGAGGDIVAVLAAHGSDRAMCQGRGVLVNLSGMWGCPGMLLIGRFDVWQNGAYAIYDRGVHGLEIHADRQERGNRPWVMRPGGAGMPNLPMAQAE